MKPKLEVGMEVDIFERDGFETEHGKIVSISTTQVGKKHKEIVSEVVIENKRKERFAVTFPQIELRLTSRKNHLIEVEH